MHAAHTEILNKRLNDSARALLACHAAMPKESDMDNAIGEAIAAQSRGYFTPSEDENLRAAYVNYLTVRSALWQVVQDLLPYIELPRKFKKGDWQSHLKAFSIAFCCSAILVRSGYYLIDMVTDRPVVREKLDEAEPRYDIRRKQFTDIYDSLVSSRRLAQYRSALQFYNRYRADIFTALSGDEFMQVADILKAEEPYFATRLRDQIKRKAKFGVFNLRRRHHSRVSRTMFFLFESIGSDIAELTQPLVKKRGAGKRITNDVREKLLGLVQPGDVFVTRHDDAMSNLFLPGFWPHAALYIGSDSQRAQMDVEPSKPEHHSIDGEVVFLESKKDGVLFRPAHDTLQVDACVILRPKISPTNMTKALNRAISHGGKLYDFAFKFESADKLACTELIYRTYNGFDGIDFKLTERAGRQCLSAEDMLNQILSHGWFEVVALFGVGNDVLSKGQQAKKRLLESYEFEHNSL